MTTQPRTLYEKIWDAHVVETRDDGTALIYIDRHLVHEVTSPQAFEALRLAGRKVRRPDLTLAVPDHNLPTTARRDSAGEVPWLMQKPYRDRQAALQQAVTQLLLSGNGKPPRMLPPDDAERFMQRTASQMAARFGPDSLKDYEAMLDDNAGPAQRCKGLYQLMETINAQAPELRAQMVRQFFGD